MKLAKGSIVLCPAGHGTVTDQAAGECLVQLFRGTVLDVTHGQWWEDGQLTVVGFNPSMMVWSGSRKRLAGELL